MRPPTPKNLHPVLEFSIRRDEESVPRRGRTQKRAKIALFAAPSREKKEEGQKAPKPQGSTKKTSKSFLAGSPVCCTCARRHCVCYERQPCPSSGRHIPDPSRDADRPTKTRRHLDGYSGPSLLLPLGCPWRQPPCCHRHAAARSSVPHPFLAFTLKYSALPWDISILVPRKIESCVLLLTAAFCYMSMKV